MSLAPRDRDLIDLHDATFDTALAEGLPLAEAQARALRAVIAAHSPQPTEDDDEAYIRGDDRSTLGSVNAG